MARTKQTARMATPRGEAAQLRWRLAQQCALAGEAPATEAEGPPVAKRKRVHWADEHETPVEPLNPRKRATPCAGKARTPLSLHVTTLRSSTARAQLAQ